MSPERESGHRDRYKASSLDAYNTKMVDQYDSLVWHRVFRTDICDEEILTEIGPEISSLRVLDIGCATGRLLSLLADAGAMHLYGVDLASGILDVARGKLAEGAPRVELRVGDAEDTLPWPDDFFNVAILSGVLHHFYRPEEALAEIRRILGPGGRLIVVEPSFPPLIRQIVNGYLRFFPHDGDCRFRSKQAAEALLLQSRFTEARSRRIGRLCYMTVADRA